MFRGTDIQFVVVQVDIVPLGQNEDHFLVHASRLNVVLLQALPILARLPFEHGENFIPLLEFKNDDIIFAEDHNIGTDTRVIFGARMIGG